MIRPVDQLSAKLGTRYGALLLILVLILVLHSFAKTHRIMLWCLDLASVALLIAAVRAICETRRAAAVAVVLGVLAAAGGAAAGSFGVDSAYPLGAGLRAVFLAYLLARILIDISRRAQITMDAVFGACCIYLLMALTWGAVYSLVEWADPTSFQAADGGALDPGGSVAESEADLIYFSMVTMTTVGYGDIHPKAPPARMLAALEAFIAQLFLAIVLARFVALAITERRADSS